MNELALFAGGGGGILGGYLLGWKTVCAVEIDNYRIKQLLQRQKDGILGQFPIWNDIRTFDGKPWRDRVDIITGGFPCQDISVAGKGAGITGERSGLWKEMSRVVSEVRPRFVFVENSPALLVRGFGVVAGDLVEMGYHLRWCILGADDAGAPHRRKRIWILAYSNSNTDSSNGEQKRKTRKIPKKHRTKRCTGRVDGTSDDSKILAYSTEKRLERENSEGIGFDKSGSFTECSIKWWDIDPADLPDTGQITKRGCEKLRQTEKTSIHPAGQNRIGSTKSRLGRVADELASRLDFAKTTFNEKIPRVACNVQKRVDRLKAIGDGQVPAVVALAFVILSEGLI